MMKSETGSWRRLSKRESAMRKKYTRMIKHPGAYAVFLKVENQRFHVHQFMLSKQEAEWWINMLAVALAKIKP